MRAAAAALFVALAGACARPAPSRSSRFLEGSVDAFRHEVQALARTKPLVVNFWATWCDPCRAEMPRLVRAARTYRGRVNFLGVDVQDDPPTAVRFVARYRVPYPNMTDGRREIVNAEHLLGLPDTEFYARGGVLVYTHRGELSEGELTRRIRALLRR